MSAQTIIDTLQLLPHPEGGYYKETYRAATSITTETGASRNVSTAIHYLLADADKSHFHRIQSDELWFFHQGQALEIVFIQDKQLVTITLGNAIERGEVPQAMIPANVWFGARVKGEAGFALVSCTVAPGFDFQDFELGRREALLQEYPHLRAAIEQFTRSN
ncbi:cupin domain-containing protein [Hymenobacter cellulosilyticus]|uniref:Cupin domain-containing protein n=1 Tax=Hymenobacter cellulosilyticus TaxID=2932248 RepID=A0A8T9Q6F7_9BACT|nr:cupin domain-containing protein [Hymenobacter cellulosilyticus]UOQ71049.1 cupin domain-containing protein [Hymenobacter cellulosilyticus]